MVRRGLNWFLHVFAKFLTLIGENFNKAGPAPSDCFPFLLTRAEVPRAQVVAMVTEWMVAITANGLQRDNDRKQPAELSTPKQSFDKAKLKKRGGGEGWWLVLVQTTLDPR